MSSIIPLGFTVIQSDFQTLDPPPDLTGAPFILPSLFTEIGVPFFEVEELVAPLVAEQPYTIQIQPSTNYPVVGSTLMIDCNLTSPTPVSGTVVLRVLSDTSDSELALTSYVSTTNATCKFYLPIAVQGLLRIVAHPLLTPQVPTRNISTQEYSQLLVRSNLSTLFTQVSPTPTAEVLVVPSGVIAVNPLADVVPRLTENLLRTTVIDQVLDLAPTNLQPHGSSGPGIYKDIGIPSPANASMHKGVPSEGLQRLLGMALDQLKRLEGWASKLLYAVHSDQSPAPNSELNLLLGLLPDSLQESLQHYAQLIQEAGQHATDLAQTYSPDYAQGNSLTKTHGVEQFNVSQFRAQTSSVFDVNSPGITFASQQHITQSRFEHHVGDIYQASHIHSFLRDEGQLTLMNATGVFYTSKESAQYSPNHTQIVGAHTKYQDSEFEQVGQASGTPIHPTNLDPQKAEDYGRSTKLVERDYQLRTSLGEITFNAGTHLYAHAAQNIQLTTASGDIKLSAAQEVSVRSGRDLQLYSIAETKVGASQLHLSSSSNVVISGSIVLINSGGSMAVPLPVEPKLITVQPQTFLPMQDPLPYPKETPVSSGPAGQKTPLTPEPNSTPAGSSLLGEFLTGG